MARASRRRLAAPQHEEIGVWLQKVIISTSDADATHQSPYPEEPRSGVSKDAQSACQTPKLTQLKRHQCHYRKLSIAVFTISFGSMRVTGTPYQLYQHHPHSTPSCRGASDASLDTSTAMQITSIMKSASRHLKCLRLARACHAIHQPMFVRDAP
jgi:hypothetical protein